MALVPLFEICIFELVFTLRTLCHLALEVNVSQRLIRQRCLVPGAFGGYGRGCGYDTGRARWKGDLQHYEIATAAAYSDHG